jgi:hypothetical protein
MRAGPSGITEPMSNLIHTFDTELVDSPFEGVH